MGTSVLKSSSLTGEENWKLGVKFTARKNGKSVQTHKFRHSKTHTQSLVHLAIGQRVPVDNPEKWMYFDCSSAVVTVTLNENKNCESVMNTLSTLSYGGDGDGDSDCAS